MNEEGKPVKTGLMLSNFELTMVVTIILLMATVGYLYGKNQGTQQILGAKQEQIPTPTQRETPTFKPTVVPVKRQYYPPTSVPPSLIPTERKKVSVFIDDYGGLTKGNFYCYEDKVNSLVDLQNRIRLGQLAHGTCTANAQQEGKNCSDTKCMSLSSNDEFSSCSQKCLDEAFAKCNSDLGDLRKQLYNDVHQYCP